MRQIGALTSLSLIEWKKIKEAHNPEVAGSNPAPATMKTRLIDGFFVYRLCNIIFCISFTKITKEEY